MNTRSHYFNLLIVFFASLTIVSISDTVHAASDKYFLVERFSNNKIYFYTYSKSKLEELPLEHIIISNELENTPNSINIFFHDYEGI